MISVRSSWRPPGRSISRGFAVGMLIALWGCPPPDPPAEEMPENGERLDPTPEVQSLSDNEARA